MTVHTGWAVGTQKYSALRGCLSTSEMGRLALDVCSSAAGQQELCACRASQKHMSGLGSLLHRKLFIRTENKGQNALQFCRLPWDECNWHTRYSRWPVCLLACCLAYLACDKRSALHVTKRHSRRPLVLAGSTMLLLFVSRSGGCVPEMVRNFGRFKDPGCWRATLKLKLLQEATSLKWWIEGKEILFWEILQWNFQTCNLGEKNYVYSYGENKKNKINHARNNDIDWNKNRSLKQNTHWNKKKKFETKQDTGMTGAQKETPCTFHYAWKGYCVFLLIHV